jgi:hypothetical protein
MDLIPLDGSTVSTTYDLCEVRPSTPSTVGSRAIHTRFRATTKHSTGLDVATEKRDASSRHVSTELLCNDCSHLLLAGGLGAHALNQARQAAFFSFGSVGKQYQRPATSGMTRPFNIHV